MLDAGLGELRAALDARRVSSVELTQAFLGRIRALDPGLNAFITVDEETSLAQAREADARLASGKAGALTGIPVAHKDIFCTRAMRTTCGSRMLEHYTSPYDAHVVEQFARAGAVLLGKTNMDEFAMGSSNETSHFGPVRNPWDRGRVPGGSSGGSAVAVAARMAPAATGTDTGGSIRQPAALAGVCGLKPTYGLVSRYGMIAFASSLDQGGPIARSAADLALLLGVMAGHDPRDSTSLSRPKEDYAAALRLELRGLRIGLPKEFFGAGTEPAVIERVREAIAWFESQGARAVPIGLPSTALAVLGGPIGTARALRLEAGDRLAPRSWPGSVPAPKNSFGSPNAQPLQPDAAAWCSLGRERLVESRGSCPAMTPRRAPGRPRCARSAPWWSEGANAIIP